MFSIAILGMIVWSQLMGLPFCERRIINFTVGWEDFTLLNTFYSSDVNNMIQSAGNSTLIINLTRLAHSAAVNRGSSETIRENSFEAFLNAYEINHGIKFKGSKDWLFWLIGFIEGDGAILVNKGRCRLVVTQKDPKSLIEIERILGFGKVKNFDKYSRYIVEDNNNCLLLYLLLNGNLVFKHRLDQLNNWYTNLSLASRLDLESLNLYNVPEIITTTNLPTLQDGWISGFTDAEGCFSVTVKKKRNILCVEARFILDQKCRSDLDVSILNQISTLFIKDAKYNKSVRLRSKTDNIYRLTIQAATRSNDIKKPNFTLIKNYFSTFKLVTSKHNSFLFWSECLDLILGCGAKQPLSSENLLKVRQIAKKINKFTIDNNPTGHAKFS